MELKTDVIKFVFRNFLTKEIVTSVIQMAFFVTIASKLLET